MRSLLKTSLPIFASLALVLLLAAVSTACPTCKDGIAQSDPAHQQMAAGYAYSILFMMSMPFLILISFGSYCYYEVRKARLRSSTGEEGLSEPATESESESL